MFPFLGPSKEGAKLEGSKHFSKELMKEYGIPTAAFKNASSYEEGLKYLKNEDNSALVDSGIVIKADQLAAGKGVFLCESQNEPRTFFLKL